MDVFKARIGQFFFFIGSILLIIFFSVDPTQNPQINMLFSGFLLTGLGMVIIWRNRNRSTQTERFRTLRRIQSRPKKEKKNKEKKS
jgi:hypothetical protein